jgi:8-amino-7-oxononanoate synthase
MSLHDAVDAYTEDLSQKGLLRVRAISSKDDLLRFDSNDYLSLTQDMRIANAYQQGYQLHPSGSGGSVLINGYHAAHQDVERAFAQWLGVDECLLFSSGYAANLALTALLGQLKASCFIDKGVHASIYDGLALSQVAFIRYLHNDLDDLSRKLPLYPTHSALITEGIFSMGGQMAPLSSISSLCSQNQVELFVDEAHSIGVLGKEGRGAVDLHGLTQSLVPLRIIPLGKAFAAQGALIAGQANWINALLQAARSLIYSTASSPALSYGLLKTLEIVIASDAKRAHLRALIECFRDSIAHSPFQWADSITPIQQLHLGCPHLAMHYATELKKQGISCSAIRQPTVSKKASGLRIVLNHSHYPEQIIQLFQQIHAMYEHTPH